MFCMGFIVTYAWEHNRLAMQWSCGLSCNDQHRPDHCITRGLCYYRVWRGMNVYQADRLLS